MKKTASRRSPIIGITPDITSPGETSKFTDSTLFVSQRISSAVLNAGGIPLILPLISSRRALKEALAQLDGVLVTGGNFDIHPHYYGETPRKGLGKPKETRTRFELELISLALEHTLPVLGICGGEQAINVAFDGSLYQDIATQVPTAMEHEQKGPKEHCAHPVRIVPGTRLHRIVGQDALDVNTTHHQAVNRFGKGLTSNATADDGIIEGIESLEHPFVLGVQWHPEYLTGGNAPQRKIFASLIVACKEARP